MNEEVIRGFLVQLGFKTDDAQAKKFEKTVEHASKLVSGFGKIVSRLDSVKIKFNTDKAQADNLKKTVAQASTLLSEFGKMAARSEKVKVKLNTDKTNAKQFADNLKNASQSVQQYGALLSHLDTVELKFKTDEMQKKKFEETVQHVSKLVTRLSAAMTALAITTVAGVKIVAKELDRLYFVSQCTGDSVKHLESLRYAAQQVGVTADTAESSIESFSRALKLNPGLSGLLKQFGIEDTQPLAQLTALLDRLKEKPFYQAAAYGNLFGIDPDSLSNLLNNLNEFKAAQADYDKRLRGFGLNADSLSNRSHAFSNQLRNLKADFHLLWEVIASRLLPILTPLLKRFDDWIQLHADDIAKNLANSFDSFATSLSNIDWDRTGQRFDAFISTINRAFTALGGLKTMVYALGSAFIASKLMSMIFGIGRGLSLLKNVGAVAGLEGAAVGEAAVGGVAATAGLGAVATGAAVVGGTALAGYGIYKLFGPKISAAWDKHIEAMRQYHDPARRQAQLRQLEQRYALPAGILDRTWNAESASGRNMTSSKGALGHFQFMPQTAKAFGVTDPNDFDQAAPAAAKKIAGLLHHYLNNPMKAMAAYNWGEGHLDQTINRFGLDWLKHIPKETLDYINRVALPLGVSPQLASRNVTLNQKTDIHIAATSSNQVANTVADKQQRINEELLRTFKGASS